MGSSRECYSQLICQMSKKITDKLVDLAPKRYRPITKQFIKFGITGTIGAIVDFSTYNLITRIFGFTAFYTVFGLNIIVANNISVMLAIVSNFFLNKYWTFRDKNNQVAKQWLGFFTFNVMTWVLNQILVAVFVSSLPIFDVLFGSQEDNMAKVFAIAIILFVNFIGSKFLIFNKHQNKVQVIGPTSHI